VFELRINTGNAAFKQAGDNSTNELIRTLEEDIIPNLVVWTGYDKWNTILDKNGNNVGSWRLQPGVSK